MWLWWAPVLARDAVATGSLFGSSVDRFEIVDAYLIEGSFALLDP